MHGTQARQHARISVAPMMDCTDRHCRYLHRQLSDRALLYTEMIASAALVRGQAVHLLDFNDEEHPVAVQLGGSDPIELAEAAYMAEKRGYDEINLNVGCPSNRVQSGAFGAVLMKTPQIVANCIEAIKRTVKVDVTVKCRIGIDQQDPVETLPDFLKRLVDAGCDRVIIHARKAWLSGLNPRENRHIPPLDYPLVLKMKDLHPDLHMSINGGVVSLAQAHELISRGLDGVMIGRSAYQRPVDIVGRVDRQFYGSGIDADPAGIVHKMIPYIESHLRSGGRLHQITRHMLGLFAGRPGARLWRRRLSQDSVRVDAGVDMISTALRQVACE